MLSCIHGMLGRKPVDHAKYRALPRLATFMTAQLPPPPASWSYIGGITNWGMMLNASLGCCTIATAGHLRMGWKQSSTGSTIVVPDSAILTAYEAVSGYNPATGANDDGAAVIDVLNYWQDTGIDGNKIAGYVAIDPTNQLEVMQAIYLFGGVYAGVNLPQSAETETSQGRPWDWDFWSLVIGGHAIPYLAYGAGGVTAITWGAAQDATWSFVQHRTEELYAIVDDDFFDAAGKTAGGLDKPALFNAMQSLRAA